MCRYTRIAPSKEDYGILISSPWYGPATLVCWDCSLVPEKFELPKEGWDHIQKVTNEYGDEYNQHVGCFCCAGNDWIAMANHVLEHIAAGEKIHDSVMTILEHKYYSYTMGREYDLLTRLSSTLAERIFGEKFYDNPKYKAFLKELYKDFKYVKYQPFPQDRRQVLNVSEQDSVVSS